MTITTAAPQRSLSSAARRGGRPGGVTATSEAVLAALAVRADATAEEVAVATGLGRSTVTKALAALGADHRVARSPGGRERGRRLADRWSLPQPAPTTDQLQLARTGPSAVLPAGERGVEGHLGRGQLRALVAARLAAQPEVEFTPSRLGSLLGRSAGAIGNALARMVEDGLAVQTTASPRRYRHAQTGEPR